MGFVRAGFRSDTNLKEHLGELIAIRFTRVAENITTHIPENKETKEAARDEVRDVVVGEYWTFGPTGATGKFKGETLVYQQLLAEQIQARPGDWHIGVLTQSEQKADSTRSVYTLEQPAKNPEATFSAVEKLVTEAGMA